MKDGIFANGQSPGSSTLDRQNVRKLTLEEPDKLKSIASILCGNSTPEEVRAKFQLCSVDTIYTWIGKYICREELLSLEHQNECDMAKKSKDDQIRELKAALKKAQKQAQLEKLRADAYDTMINLAEETFNIPIRKKSGTKQ